MSTASWAARLVTVAALAMPLGISPALAETTLRIGVRADTYKFDEDRFSFTQRRPSTRITEPAVKPDENFLPAPLLFDTWEYSDGTYHIGLREGITFSDGSPLDAESAIAALRLYDQHRYDYLQIDQDSFEVQDDLHFSFRSEIGSALVIENMTSMATSFFSAKTDRSVNPVGTGPYRLEAYEPRQHISVVRNESYWGEAPLIDRLDYRFIADDQARLLALRNGEIDVIADVTPEMMLSMPQDGSVVVHESRPIQYVALLANLNGKAPYDIIHDIRVRQALAWAIDRETIAQVLYDGRGVPAKGILPNWMFNLGDAYLTGFGHDPAKAAALLDEAGWTMGADGIREKDGRKLRLRLVAGYPGVSRVRPMPEMLEQMFAAIGVDIELIEIDDSGVYYATYMDVGEGDLFMEFGSNNNTDPTYLLFNLFTSGTPWGSYVYTAPGPHVDALLQGARAAQSYDDVVDMVRQAHKAIVEEDLAAIPILMVPNFVLSRQGLSVPMSEYTDWIDYGRVGGVE